MIDRGTCLRPGLSCIDSKEGIYTDKRRFYIFDYLGNFEYFRTNKEGIEGQDTQSLSESIFVKRIRIIHTMQQSNFTDVSFQEWRSELVQAVLTQMQALNTELISVKLKMQYIERYKKAETFICLSELDKHDLCFHLAPLVYMDDKDEYAKRFDNLMYGLILASIELLPSFSRLKNQLCDISSELEKRSTIPQIKDKLPLIQSITTNEFWIAVDLLQLETVRKELRGLIKFIVDEGSARSPVYTSLSDEVLLIKEGETIDPAYDFEDYKLKVNRYIEEHRDHIAIFKLRNNIKLNETDYQALSDILIKDLGTEEDYKREFKDLPFGLLVRKVAKLEYDAAMLVFSDFINDQSLNQQQIVFVKKIVDYVVQNGYVENVEMLMHPPFDKPQSLIKIFDNSKQTKLIQLIKKINDNAVSVG